MVVVEGHIFAGVWLVDGAFADILVDDPSQLEKRMAKGIQELTVVECTAMCSGQNVSFDEAAAMAKRRVSNYGKFYFAIDVKRARSRGIRPLPIRVQTANGFEVLHEDRKEKEVTGGSDSKIEIFDKTDAVGAQTSGSEPSEYADQYACHKECCAGFVRGYRKS